MIHHSLGSGGAPDSIQRFHFLPAIVARFYLDICRSLYPRKFHVITLGRQLATGQSREPAPGIEALNSETKN